MHIGTNMVCSMARQSDDTASTQANKTFNNPQNLRSAKQHTALLTQLHNIYTFINIFSVNTRNTATETTKRTYKKKKNLKLKT